MAEINDCLKTGLDGKSLEMILCLLTWYHGTMVLLGVGGRGDGSQMKLSLFEAMWTNNCFSGQAVDIGIIEPWNSS